MVKRGVSPRAIARAAVRPQTLAWTFVVLVVLFRFAQPILDGDLFWHMAHARQMLERRTLVPDHTAFSWTPTDNSMIYCAWAAQLWLHGLWEGLGPWTLFVLRYAAVLGAVGLATDFASRAAILRSLVIPALALLFVLMSQLGTFIKAEPFSFVFLSLVVYVYFRAKLARDRGREPAAIFYAVPVLIALWANHHGGFVMVAPFLLATAAGETLNRRTSPALALSRRSLGHLAAAWALTGLAVLAAPYGIDYPRQLLDAYVLGASARPDAAVNAAHVSLFAPSKAALHFIDYVVLLGGTLIALVVQRLRTAAVGARIDWAIVLVNITFAVFLAAPRTSYFWPAIGLYSAMLLLGQSAETRRRNSRIHALARWPGSVSPPSQGSPWARCCSSGGGHFTTRISSPTTGAGSVSASLT